MVVEKLYYVEINGSFCGIQAAASLRAARSDAVDEWGRDHQIEIRLATDDDIAAVRAMGGYVPELGAAVPDDGWRRVH